jgi:hypothetical protein
MQVRRLFETSGKARGRHVSFETRAAVMAEKRRDEPRADRCLTVRARIELT